jgi:hypothetical protein
MLIFGNEKGQPTQDVRDLTCRPSTIVVQPFAVRLGTGPGNFGGTSSGAEAFRFESAHVWKADCAELRRDDPTRGEAETVGAAVDADRAAAHNT